MSEQHPENQRILDVVDAGYEKTLAMLEQVNGPSAMLAWWQALELALKLKSEALQASTKARGRT